MTPELTLCIPGNWKDRSELLHAFFELEPKGRYMFAGQVLLDTATKDHLNLEFCPADPRLGRAFAIAGQGKIPAPVLATIDAHLSVVYLRFPLDILDQQERVLKYTQILQRVGGLAVKVENSGTAHTWERWFSQLSGSAFDVYSAMVILVGAKDGYYSCGMHHFGLPECEVPVTLPLAEAAEVLNRFNYWLLVERPQLESGHTFSLGGASGLYRLEHRRDVRHQDGELFWNSHGVWHLEVVP